MIFHWWSRQSYLRNTYEGAHDGINPDTFFAESTIDRAYAERLLRSFIPELRRREDGDRRPAW